jgi:hypothetical protein
MLLLAIIFGIFGGLARQLYEEHRGDEEDSGKIRWVAPPVIGAAAAVAILWAFPPQVPTVTTNSDGTSKTSYAYDLVKLISLSLIAGYGGGSILKLMEARVQAQASEQKIETVNAEKEALQAKAQASEQRAQAEQQKAEATKIQIARVKANTPNVAKDLVHEAVVDGGVQTEIKEHLEEVAKEAPSKVVEELKKSGVNIDDQQARQAIAKAQSTVDVDERLDSIQGMLKQAVGEAAELIPSRVEERIEDVQGSTSES